MRTVRSFALTVAALLSVAGLARPQMMMRPPDIPGVFKPVVGEGAEYQITSSDGKTHDWAMAVVGKEAVDGQDAYWYEMRTNSERGGKVVMKQLMVMQPGNVSIKRMIVQPPGRPPMEMPVAMMNMRMPHGPQAPQAEAGSGHGMGEVVGTETVSVPAGTFECQHFRSTGEGKTSDVWVSSKVSPYGMVKMTSSDGTSMVLQKVLEHESSQIQGEPQKLNMPGMPTPQ